MPLRDDLPGPEQGADNFAYKAQTTHAVFVVKASWLNRKVDVAARAPGLNALGLPASVWIRFGTSASMEVDRTAFVTGTPPAWTPSANSGRPIRDGETKDYTIKPTWTHFAVESDLTDVEIYITPSDFPKHETQAG
jgi:hypothetical protein